MNEQKVKEYIQGLYKQQIESDEDFKYYMEKGYMSAGIDRFDYEVDNTFKKFGNQIAALMESKELEDENASKTKALLDGKEGLLYGIYLELDRRKMNISEGMISDMYGKD